jgi:hypothetical protein
MGVCVGSKNCIVTEFMAGIPLLPPPLFALLFRSLFLSFVPINWLINERAVQSSGGNLESFVLLKLAVLEHNPYLRVRIIGSIAKGTYPTTLSSPRPSLTARGK